MPQLVDFCISATERLLLLLGWDRVHAKKTSSDEAYSAGKKTQGRMRKRKNGAHVKRPSKAEWDKEVNLAPVTQVSATSTPPSATSSNWTADAFDTAVTGTV